MSPEHVFQPTEHTSGKRERLQIADIATFDEALQQLLDIVGQEYPDLTETAIFSGRFGGQQYYEHSGQEARGLGYKYFDGVTGLTAMIGEMFLPQVNRFAMEEPDTFWFILAKKQMPEKFSDPYAVFNDDAKEEEYEEWADSEDGQRQHSFSARGYNARVSQLNVSLCRSGEARWQTNTHGIELRISDQGENYSLQATKSEPIPQTT